MSAQLKAIDLRSQMELRGLIDKYVDNGWSVEARSPRIVISRGRVAKHVSYGILKDGRS